MDVHSLLPLLDGWKWSPVDVDDEKLDAGEKFSYDFVKGKPGWVWFYGVTLKGNNAETSDLKIRTDNWQLDTSIEAQHGAGMTNRGIYLPAVTRYDDTLDVYTLNIEFVHPAPWKQNLRAQIIAPETNSIEVDGILLKVTIEDMDKFRSSLKELEVA